MKKIKARNEREEKIYTKKLFLWAVISGLVSAALGIGVLVYYFVPRDKDTYILTIPPYSAIESGNGTAEIKVKREWVYSSEIPRGEIISQEPYAGARRKLKRGDSIELTVLISLGEKTERVPELSGVGAASAAAALRGLRARVRSVAIYGEGEDGAVLYTSPPADSEIKAGDTVTIFVSRHRVEQPIKVPSFCGLELAEAYRYALSLGLYIADGDTIFLNATVKEQSIPEGAFVRQGSYISFRVEYREENERGWPPKAFGAE